MVEVTSADCMMTAGEVAALFRVDPKTITRWAKDGRLSWTRTLGGHRRFSRTEVNGLLAQGFHQREAG